ncbi:MAG TPA: glycosyltransferase [Acidimicrobiia bacterium]|nr:glycosyltransferase [Acidimicrobiia bacterium]
MGSPEKATRKTVDVSLITTLYNESDSVVELLDSVMNGTVRPYEVVVADGGSTDETVALLKGYASQHPQVRVLTDTGWRSTGRNTAISAARHDHIVCIDGGCVAEPTWLEEITKPLLEGAEWVGGFYRPKGKTSLSTAIGLTMVFVEEEVVFPDFLPSARSMAFHRSLWQKVGGFPEEARLNEDTPFAEALVAAGHQPVFVPEAVVEWQPPSGLLAQARTTFAWARGDGHLGLRSIHYRQLFPRFAFAGTLLLLGIVVDRRILLLVPLPLIPMTYRKSRQKYRHMEGWLKWLWIPLATLNGLAFSLAGYITGYWERRSRRWSAGQ